MAGTAVGTATGAVTASGELLAALVKSLSSSFLGGLHFVSDYAFFDRRFEGRFRVDRVLWVPTLLRLLNCRASDAEGRAGCDHDGDSLRVVHREDSVADEGSRRDESR